MQRPNNVLHLADLVSFAQFLSFLICHQAEIATNLFIRLYIFTSEVLHIFS